MPNLVASVAVDGTDGGYDRVRKTRPQQNLYSALPREAVRQAAAATLRADQLIETAQIAAEFFIVLPGTSAEIARLYAGTLEPALRQPARLPSAMQNMAIDIRERTLCLAGGQTKSLRAATGLAEAGLKSDDLDTGKEVGAQAAAEIKTNPGCRHC